MNEYEHLSDADLTDTYLQLTAMENSIKRKKLAVATVIEDRNLWNRDGATSMAAWIVGHAGAGHDTANEEVRVANALEVLPAVARTYEEGTISWDQVRAATEFVTEETDQHMAAELPEFTAGQVRRMARRFKKVSREQACTALEERSLSMRWVEGGNRLRFHGQLPAAEGALFEKAIDFVVRKNTVNAPIESPEGWRAHAADALVELASQNLNAAHAGARAMVAIHVDAAVLSGGDGLCELENGQPLAIETMQRMACDASWYFIVHGTDGGTVGIGHANRQVPWWLAAEVRRRDDGCRWKGCERKGWVNDHHIIPWPIGPTDLSNLVMLCTEHHRKIHEQGWAIEGDPNDQLTFIAPDGRRFPEGPTPLRENLKERIDEVTQLSPTGTEAGPSPP